jgi:hypothetical protein
MRNQVISLYDYTGQALIPWAEAGYDCYAYDIQHKAAPEDNPSLYRIRSGGSIYYFKADLYDLNTLRRLISLHLDQAAFMSAFPPCADLESSGRRRWPKKEKINPHFQTDAVSRVLLSDWFAGVLGCPYYIENPVGALPRLWHKPDFRFDPCDFGGYLPEDDVHPKWPEVIPARDAYRKRTCLWTGGGFKMPMKRSVPQDPPVWFVPFFGSVKSYTRRDAPRGFARAVFQFNRPSPVLVASAREEV